MVPISTVIITKNEEENIERCLKSVTPISAEIIIVDSESQDATVAIAKQYTEKVYVRKWPGFAEQRRFALTKTKNKWVLSLDADEELSPGLLNEIQAADFTVDGYHIPRMVRYLNQWIKHCGWYPDYVLRLFDQTQGEYSTLLVHETFMTTGKTKRLKNAIHHYPYQNIAHHLTKIDHYTTLAARQMHRKRKKKTIFAVLTHPLFYFIKSYFLKRGFLDGSAGLIICLLGSYYNFLKYAKYWEFQNCQEGVSPPEA